MKTITLPVANRPQYLKELLDSLRRNNLDEFKLFCGIEPKNDEVLNLCKNIDFVDKTIIINKKKLGVRKNPYNIIQTAFNTGSQFNIHLEDDLIVSPDMINLANWYYDTFQLNSTLYTVYGLFAYDSNPGKPDQIIEISRFDGYGWCCFKQNWNQLFKKYWFNDSLGKKYYKKKGWDWAIQGAFKEFELKALKPILSRTNNIGREGGTFSTPLSHDKTFANLQYNTDKIIKNFRFQKEF